MGYTQSPLVDEYKLYGTLTFNDIVSFYKSNIQSQNRVITVYGNAQMIDEKKLAEYGNVVELKLKNIKVD
jgi:Zn-dependent M16 (insulinase) family peptidase